MATTSKEAAAGLIGGLYTIDFTQPLAHVAPPLAAFAAHRSGLTGYMAVSVQRGWPVRVRALGAMVGFATSHILPPLAHGPAAMPNGTIGYFIICPAPPGPSLLATLRPWPEAELTDFVLKPMALALGELLDRTVTHRAIRADNLFQAAPRTPVTLGCAWASPPACHQPSWMEPPYSAVCLPAGRGDGRIADDVYALGALMVMLALGKNPVEGVPDDEILRRKLDFGSYAALVGDHRLPLGLVDLVRGMLADDPEHRPSPSLLANPAAARARRIAARPPRRAQRPIDVGGQAAWTARMLAHAMVRAPEIAGPMLRNGTIDRWLRRGVGDVAAAASIDEAVRLRDADVLAADGRADALLITRAVAILDPAAPLVWRRLAIWPDGLGSALDHALNHGAGAGGRPGGDRHRPCGERLGRTAGKRRRRGGGTVGGYGNSPLVHRRPQRDGSLAAVLPPESARPLRVACHRPGLGDPFVGPVASLGGERRPGTAGRPAAGRPPDRRVHRSAPRRTLGRGPQPVGRGADRDGFSIPASAPRPFAGEVSAADLPFLSQWAVAAVESLLQQYSSRSRREKLAKRLASLAQAGQLPPIVAVLDDEQEQSGDQSGLAAAQARLADIDASQARWESLKQGRALQARRVGQEVADGVGMLACVVALALAIFG